MKIKLTGFFCIFFLILMSVNGMAGDQDSTCCESKKGCMAVADSLSDAWNHEEAASKYKKILEEHPDKYEALWKAARELTEWANFLPEDEKELKEPLFLEATDMARKATKVNPEGWEGYYRLSVALGRLALFRGGKEKINLSKAVKAAADSSIMINPDEAGPYHVLGRWHQNLANLSWFLRAAARVIYGGAPPGSNEEALALFQKCIELEPNKIRHHLELARTDKYLGEKDKMKEPLETVLALPESEEEDPGFKEEAKEMLKKLK